jgi:16S rRNA (guanine966-N2)-methyltransferase
MKNRKSAKSNRLRIIGGRLRGRKLGFPDVGGLRPTPDRVRETLFNWLQPVIAGARCLDLFAGSGALAFEALSRGAGHCVAVERDAAAVAALRENAMTLAVGGQLDIIHGSALDWLQGPVQAFDIAFLDPPYHQGLLEPCLETLLQPGWLASGARIYVETAVDESLPEPGAGIEVIREKRAGQVMSYLLAPA